MRPRRKEKSVNDDLTDHEARMEVYYWQRSNTSSLYNVLLYAISKADKSNRARIGQGFPALVAAWWDWTEAPDEEKFFQEVLAEEKRLKNSKREGKEL